MRHINITKKEKDYVRKVFKTILHIEKQTELYKIKKKIKEVTG